MACSWFCGYIPYVWVCYVEFIIWNITYKLSSTKICYCIWWVCTFIIITCIYLHKLMGIRSNQLIYKKRLESHSHIRRGNENYILITLPSNQLKVCIYWERLLTCWSTNYYLTIGRNESKINNHKSLILIMKIND